MLVLDLAQRCLTLEIFSPLNAVIPRNLRLIAYNQRGYYGSTPLSKGERELTDPPEELAIEYTKDLIEFLEYILSHHSLPRKPILLGWSKGTNFLIAIAAPSFLTPDLRRRGLAAASAFILYEPPGNAFGLKTTEDYKRAMSGGFPGNATPEQKNLITTQRFANWISGFYKHENLASDPPIYGLDPVGFSADLLDPELLSRASEPGMVAHGFHWSLSTRSAERAELAKQSIQQKDIPIAIAWNGETPAYIISAIKAGEALGAKVYKLDEKGNHLFFAHEPRKFIQAISKVVSDITGHRVGNRRIGQL